ncbi:RNA polymerase sigma factor SigZ [Pseudoalteromonas aurantia]|uniref:RNA polymerase sigma factor SigZ n=1 Tax=Pseudoalteromonas aurantia 208 TaxID=1314867 RepID=A0ABR9EJ68_9GAMM|nr:RNA polymerase sigma factor SigZ [Pseudoalteromonas aurantia]MBE0371018.1 RNA polymerase sigma-70 factor, ECF subfamily [Pseudoalteromonas aurantia 208]
MNLEAIWADYQSSVKAFLYKHISNPSDVEDLLQDILIKTYQNLGTVKDTKKVKSWVFQIANHAIIDFYRKRATISKINEQVLWYETNEEDIYSQLSHCVTAFINGLPDSEAKLLTAIDIDGISQKDYAALNGMKYSTLKSRVKKSRQNLSELFNQCCELSINSKGELIDFDKRDKKCSSC